MPTLVLVLSLAFACVAPAGAQPLEPATPESQGMDSAALAQLVGYGANVKMDSLVVLRHGRLVAEAYYAPFARGMVHRLNSTTKAVVGALAGIALARGELPALDTSVQELLPEAAQSAPDGRWATVRLQHLLGMTSGMRWDEPPDAVDYPSVREMERSADWSRFILQRELRQTPGLVFNYNSGNPHLVAAALQRRTGQDLEAYAAQHLFESLGIRKHRWRKDPQGVAIGGFGLYLETTDMARLGLLYLQGGQWNGRQVLPRAWAERVFAPQLEIVELPGYRYADYWWSKPGRKAYFTSGFNRQLILVLPELGIVAAATGRAHYPFDDLISHLERAARSATPLPENPAAQAALQQAVQAAAAGRPWPAADAVTATATARAEPVRGNWRLPDNRIGIREFSLDFTTQPPSYHVKLRTRDFNGRIGMDGRWGEGADAGTPVFTRGAWKDRTTLLLQQDWPEEAGSLSYEIRFDGADIEFIHTNQFGVRGVARGVRAD